MQLSSKALPVLGLLLSFSAVPVLAQQPPPSAPQPQVMQTQGVQRPEIALPEGLTASTVPNAVILRGNTTRQALQGVVVQQRFDRASLMRDPIISFHGARLDTRPVLNNPAAVANIAASLRQQPGLVTVSAERTEMLVIPQGLVVRQFMSYQLKSGACADAERRARLQQLWVGCFTALSDHSLRAALADPASPRYVADPTRRGQQLTQMLRLREQSRSEMAADMRTLRSYFADPARRTEMVEALGSEAEVARLERLDDDALGAEIANTAEVKIEEDLFVPKPGATFETSTRSSSGAEKPTAAGSQTLPERIYLTGFTYGEQYEWSRKVSITINWCFIGCSRTYFLRPYAGFEYGFGLRLPTRISAIWTYQSGNTATLTPTIGTLNASAQQFAETGIASNKIFNGQELVAQVGAWAGFQYKIPGNGTGDLHQDVKKNLTEYLPEGLTNGQFQPPAPGSRLNIDKTFTQVDFLTGLLNLGFAGARISPGIRLGLSSDRLDFGLIDHVANDREIRISNGKSYSLAVDKASGSSRFSLGDPIYNLGFSITPGIVPGVWVDVRLWSDGWEWPIWFPQLELKLPPAGLTFGCHAGTICTREYVLSASGASETSGDEKSDSDSPLEEQMRTEMEAWRLNVFEKHWQPQCPSQEAQGGVRWCQTAIAATGQRAVDLALEDVRGQVSAAGGAAKMSDKVRKGMLALVNIRKTDANVEAHKIINETQEAARKRAMPPRLKDAPPPKSQAPNTPPRLKAAPAPETTTNRPAPPPPAVQQPKVPPKAIRVPQPEPAPH